ncbi:hypothetical protein PPERSA_10142 [Pseudocohnilembus persalinus]|uniref:Tubulin-tyrosine ligase family protein n=1 Tax=Pseudocohnilembus persalinus TaxID=266149 RepID=A0A0V0QM72_PSEPJ|nr:hypothetical protein PPERSA_10142 [Pseudocohnilembus persalinus]|eukprot:KRX03061.1 hypothetical protein PPERSA_10142 [Pseudocohnilembus persalinus]
MENIYPGYNVPVNNDQNKNMEISSNQQFEKKNQNYQGLIQNQTQNINQKGETDFYEYKKSRIPNIQKLQQTSKNSQKNEEQSTFKDIPVTYRAHQKQIDSLGLQQGLNLNEKRRHVLSKIIGQFQNKNQNQKLETKKSMQGFGLHVKSLNGQQQQRQIIPHKYTQQQLKLMQAQRFQQYQQMIAKSHQQQNQQHNFQGRIIDKQNPNFQLDRTLALLYSQQNYQNKVIEQINEKSNLQNSTIISKENKDQFVQLLDGQYLNQNNNSSVLNKRNLRSQTYQQQPSQKQLIDNIEKSIQETQTIKNLLNQDFLKLSQQQQFQLLSQHQQLENMQNGEYDNNFYYQNCSDDNQNSNTQNNEQNNNDDENEKIDNLSFQEQKEQKDKTPKKNNDNNDNFNDVTPTKNDSPTKQKLPQFPKKKDLQNKAGLQPFKFGNQESQQMEVFNRKFYLLRDFNFKINYSNDIFIPVLENLTAPYTIYIGRGNNKGMIKRRWWWQIVDDESQKENCHFIWTQLKVEKFLNQIPKLSEYKNIASNDDSQNTQLNTNNELQNKNSLNQSQITVLNGQEQPEENQKKQIKNIQNQSPKKLQKQNQKSNSKNNNNKHNQEQVDPLTKIFSANDLKDFQNYNQKYKKKDEDLEAFDFSYRFQFLNQEKVKKIQKYENSNQFKVHNHLEFNWQLGNKKALFYNMQQYYTLQKKNVFDYLPLTFHIKNGLQDKEFKNFLRFFREQEKAMKKQDSQKLAKNKKKIKNIWIVKPGEISNRGNGISVCDNINQILTILSKKEKHASTGKEKTYILQQYLDKPFLYNKRKFDIRCYMLITCVNSCLKAYWYSEGYIRTSGSEFDLSDVTDVFTHLTNDAIQKDCDNYAKFEEGNKEYSKDAVKATYLKLDPNQRQNTFEIFGLDFMIDSEFKPWLIEINTNPDITTTCSALLARIVPNMVENALRIGLDPFFPPPINWPNPKKHQVQDNILDNNKFSLIFDSQVDGDEVKKLYQDQKLDIDGIGHIDEEEEMNDTDVEEEDKTENTGF